MRHPQEQRRRWLEMAEANARRVNPELIIFRVSATSGEGLAAWVSWIEAGLEAQRGKHAETVDALRRRVAELERQLERQLEHTRGVK